MYGKPEIQSMLRGAMQGQQALAGMIPSSNDVGGGVGIDEGPVVGDKVGGGVGTCEGLELGGGDGPSVGLRVG